MANKTINTKIVIAELHRAFKMFNENLFNNGLPEPAILIQSRGNKKLTLGWCSVQKIWKNEITEEEKYEINIVAEALNRGVYPVMTTLLHEMVHLYNLVNGIKDTSRGNTYHNMKFKQTAESHGLLIEHADKIGWSVSELQGTTMNLIDSYEFDEAVFSLGRRDFDAEEKPKKKKKSSSRKYICPECGTSIRASKDVNICCADCSNVEEGKMVMFYKEPTEDDFEDGEENLVEYVCLDCGCVLEQPEGSTHCPECGGELKKLEDIETAEPVEEPTEEEPPAGIVEVDVELNDGAGNMIPVKQGMIDVHAGNSEDYEDIDEETQEAFARAWEERDNTGWEELRIREVLMDANNQGVSLGLYATNTADISIEISDKMKSQWALYKEGKKFTFSKHYLEEATDEEIEDTIKHQYIHHYQWIMFGLKVNHKKDFKALCEKLGVSLEVPTKNHRAMK